MSQSFEELFRQTAHVRENTELVQLVAGADSPTEAENRAKDLEYPTHLVRETRLLAKARRDYSERFYTHKIIPGGDRVDPVRYFNCTYSEKPGEKEEYGVLAVKPDFHLPPLFWAYTLLDADGEKLFSLEDVSSSKEYFNVVVSDSSRSIPAGLAMHIWPSSDLVQFSFTHPISQKKCIWQIYKKGWPTGAEYLRWQEAESDLASFRPVLEEDKRGIEDLASMERYVLVISEREGKNSKSDQGWISEDYKIEGKYFFVSPWEDRTRFAALGGRMIPCPARESWRSRKKYLSIEHEVSLGASSLHKTRSIEEVVSAVLTGMPRAVKTAETLHNLFSFKTPHMPSYNKDTLIPLVPMS